MFDLIPLNHGERSLFHDFDQMMDDGFFRNWNSLLAPCRTDILDKGDKFILKADLPGFQKPEISLSVEGDRLTLSAEHKEDVNDGNKNYIRRERHRSFSRSFDLDGIDVAHISASYVDGVLEVSLPKQAEAKPETKQISIQ